MEDNDKSSRKKLHKVCRYCGHPLFITQDGLRCIEGHGTINADDYSLAEVPDYEKQEQEWINKIGQQ